MGDGAVANTSVTARVFNFMYCQRRDWSRRAEENHHQREPTTQTNDEPEWLCCCAVHLTCFLAQPLRTFAWLAARLLASCCQWLVSCCQLGITFWILAEDVWAICGNKYFSQKAPQIRSFNLIQERSRSAVRRRGRFCVAHLGVGPWLSPFLGPVVRWEVTKVRAESHPPAWPSKTA